MYGEYSILRWIASVSLGNSGGCEIAVNRRTVQTGYCRVKALQ